MPCQPKESCLAVKSDAVGLAALAAFFLVLIGRPILRGYWAPQGLALFDAFYRSGALVFGGGHVVLPLLREAFVTPGWISDDSFSPAMALRKQSPVRCSPSPPISAAE